MSFFPLGFPPTSDLALRAAVSRLITGLQNRRFQVRVLAAPLDFFGSAPQRSPSTIALLR